MRIEELDTPAIVVDMDVLGNNLRSMSEYCSAHHLQLRPHTKTHKIPAIAKMQRDYGSRGITVAKTGEAEVMAAAGIDDILVHYPVSGESKAARLADLARTNTITVALDSFAVAQSLSTAASKAGSVIRVLVELDSGMRRCGVASPADAVALAHKVAGLPGLQLAGITTYPGHIWSRPEAQAPDVEKLGSLLLAARHEFQRGGLACEVVSAGSTPTARNSHLAEVFTEIRPGTYAFNDRNTAGVGACSLGDCALRVIVTVVSTAVKGRVIVDGGSKTFTSDRWISGDGGHGHIVEYPDMTFAAMSEEHGHLDIGVSATSPGIGDRVTIIPNHVCSCVNLHDSIYFHQSGVVEGCWTVEGRGRIR